MATRPWPFSFQRRARPRLLLPRPASRLPDCDPRIAQEHRLQVAATTPPRTRYGHRATQPGAGSRVIPRVRAMPALLAAPADRASPSEPEPSRNPAPLSRPTGPRQGRTKGGRTACSPTKRYRNWTQNAKSLELISGSRFREKLKPPKATGSKGMWGASQSGLGLSESSVVMAGKRRTHSGKVLPPCATASPIPAHG